jgi:hypothetical protein
MSSSFESKDNTVEIIDIIDSEDESVSVKANLPRENKSAVEKAKSSEVNNEDEVSYNVKEKINHSEKSEETQNILMKPSQKQARKTM